MSLERLYNGRKSHEYKSEEKFFGLSKRNFVKWIQSLPEKD